MKENDLKYISDWNKADRNQQLHLACWAVREFQDKYGRLPQLLCDIDAEEVIIIANDINARNQFKVKIVQEGVVKMVSLYARAQIAPMATFWGGIVAQEVLKYTGKFTPIYQFMFFDWFEIVEDSQDRTRENSRYDDQISLIGKKPHSYLTSCKSLLIGAGSLGNELLKLFALMGLSSKNGHIVLSDEALIKHRHLPSHSLLTLNDLGSKKSLKAASSALTLNNSLNISTTHFNISCESESFQTDDLWESQDFIISTVRNSKSKLFIDEQSVLYEIPAIIASSKGLKGTTHINLPFLSRSYSENPEEPDLNPFIKLNSFPYLPGHCLAWAEAKFDETFQYFPKEVISFIDNPNAFFLALQHLGNFSSGNERLKKVENFLRLLKSFKFEDCVKVFIEMFQDLFYESIRKILRTFPPDYNDQYGGWFWTEVKRRPDAFRFDLNDPAHLGFIYAGANVMASVLGCEQVRDLQAFRKIIERALDLEEGKRNEERFEMNRIRSEEEEKRIMMNTFDRVCGINVEKQIHEIRMVLLDADDDENLHVEFVFCAARLRARNYRIAEMDWIDTKIYLAKIRPEVVTANAILAGTVAMELYKLVLKSDSKDFRDICFNSSMNFYTLYDILEPGKTKSKDFDPIMMGPVKACPEGFTKWDKIIIQGPLSVNQFIQKVFDDHGLKINGIICKNKFIYDEFSKKTSLNIRDKQVHELYEEKIGGEINLGKRCLSLEIMCESETDGIEYMVPLVKYSF